MQNKHQRQPRWLDRLVRRLGYVPEHRIPEVGTIMHPDEPDFFDDKNARPSVEILEVDDVCVRYRFPDGTVHTRSKRGFMKNYSHAPND